MTVITARTLLLAGAMASCMLAQSFPAGPPVFQTTFSASGKTYRVTIAGRSPQQGGATTIPVVLVPISLHFDADGHHPEALNASLKTSAVLQSPIFQKFPFATGDTQYADAVQRAQFYKLAKTNGWHTLLGDPRVLNAVEVQVPVANGYLLHSARTGRSLGIADLDFVQKQLFEHLRGSSISSDTLIVAFAADTAFYSLADATVCCSAGTHGVQLDASGKPEHAFVLASYFDATVMPGYEDVQGITQQLGEWLNDPLHGLQANKVPRWQNPDEELGCGGSGLSSPYLLQQPSEFLPGKSAQQLGTAGRVYHLANIALLPWFAQSPATDTFESAYTFPNTKIFDKPAAACSFHRARTSGETVSPVQRNEKTTHHDLIGYWEGYASSRTKTRLRDVSPQWDVIIATFASPVKGSTSKLAFALPPSLSDAEFKADIGFLQSQGKKVLISLGGGGQVVTLKTPADLRDFVQSVSAIVARYGFDGVDLDIETPSLMIEPGDTDYRHPTTPSIVNLIDAMHQLRRHFGSHFMISEVPEAAQAQAGLTAYGGQFGSFLPVIYGTRDILSFVDAQDYNTPPLEALDGNYYFPGGADYHVAITELLLHGFYVGGNRKEWFPPISPEKVAVGLPATPTSARNYTAIPDVESALRALITPEPFRGAAYKLQRPSGYPKFKGAMFWAINEDRRNGYQMSNAIGSLLHRLP